ncbi:MAG: hypothetical protein PF692_06555 [Kiritimatiellae bacterium]|jgi:hypothetical protein|nr:hypothetical protein [Kiritimatiellia bacterium]
MENKINSFNLEERTKAFENEIKNADLSTKSDNVNMHFHSFYSYNGKGWSPMNIVMESAKAGLYAAALCDFDVLDGMNEFISASEKVGLRYAINLETRVYINELSDVDISSPGEPGVSYIMGGGFFELPKDGTPQAKTLQSFKDGAKTRNIDLISRINAKLEDIALDYNADVFPLTPAGVATERHIITAYVNKIFTVYGQDTEAIVYLSDLLGVDSDTAKELIANRPTLEEKVRSKLAKAGGIGYVQPSKDTFPAVEDFISWVSSCDAIPMATWLDGTSDGEADAEKLMDLMCSKGCKAINIIPDRNWNYKDEKTAKIKQAKLKAIIEASIKRDIPINIGTEMNKLGLPFVDDLEGPVLSQYKDEFKKGAEIMVGHTVLAKYAGFSYTSAEADEMFETNAEKNEFFRKIGALPGLTNKDVEQFESIGKKDTLKLLLDKVIKDIIV